jgi:NitT/TauT family transport system substrate-binding protein
LTRFDFRSEQLRPLRILISIALLSLSVVGSNCRHTNTGSAQPFKITINSWIGFAPLYIAQERGLFEKEGIKVELVRIEDTGARKSAMIANQVDAYGASVDGVALDVAQGMPGHIVMAFDQSNGSDGIIAKTDIRTISDLKGRTVAVQPGLTGHFLLMYVLARNGLNYKDVNITDMDSDKAGAAFAAKQVDVAVTWEPWLSQAQEKGGHKLVTSAELPGVIVDTLCVTEKAHAEKSDHIKAVIRAWFAALDYMKSHKSDATQIMAKSYGLTEQQVGEYLSGIKLLGNEENKAYLGTVDKPGQVFEIYTMANDIWKANGIIDSVSRPQDRIDTNFVQGIR